MDMDIARPAEQAIFEMMRLEIGDGMRHVLFARQKRLFPDDFLSPPDARHAVDVGGQIANQQLRADACGPELRMREPKIVLALGDMVGELIAERESDTERRAGVIDKVDANDLRLFAAIEREMRGWADRPRERRAMNHRPCKTTRAARRSRSWLACRLRGPF